MMRRRPRVRGAGGPAAAAAGRFFATIRYWMFGRSKLATKCRRHRSPSRLAISACVASVRSVSAILGTFGSVRGRHRQREIVRPEVVSHCADAVRLIDGERGDLATVQELPRRVQLQPLGREIQHVQLAGEEHGLDEAPLAQDPRASSGTRPAPERRQRVDLVLHQRDERRDHDPDTWRTSAGSGSTRTCRYRSTSGRARHRRR